MAITAVQFSFRASSVTIAPFVTVLEGITGQFESTNSGAVQAVDEVNYKIETFGGTGSVGYDHLGCLFANTDILSLIETFVGLVRASVQTVNGLALASVNVKNGLQA